MSVETSQLTLTGVADSIESEFGKVIPSWKLRRVVDDLESSNRLQVKRVARLRTVTAGDVKIIAAELQRMGWLPTQEAASC